jgi:hypothetical protein
VTADRADLAIRDLVLTRLDSDDLLTALSLAVSRSRHEADMKGAAQQLARHPERLAELDEMWATGEITRAEGHL